MTGRKPAHNPLAIMLAALLMLYVASYLVIRFNSAWYPRTSLSPGGKNGLIVFGVTQSEHLAALSPSAPAKPTNVVRRHQFLRAVYYPLCCADQWLTRTAI